MDSGDPKALGFVEQSNREESFSEGKSEPCRRLPLNLSQRNDWHMNVRKITQSWVKNNLRELEGAVSDIYSGLGRVPAPNQQDWNTSS